MVMELLDVKLELLEIEVQKGATGVEDGLLVGSAFDLFLNVFEEEGSILINETTHDLLADVCLEWSFDAIG